MRLDVTATLDPADREQRHGPEVDIAPARDLPGGAQLAVTESSDAERALAVA